MKDNIKDIVYENDDDSIPGEKQSEDDFADTESEEIIGTPISNAPHKYNLKSKIKITVTVLDTGYFHMLRNYRLANGLQQLSKMSV